MVAIVPSGAEPHDMTVLSGEFLDVYLPKANGEFVKIYLCYLRLLQKSADKEVAVSDIADRLSCTERDVVRALRYWEGEGLISLAEKDAARVRDASAALPEKSAVRGKLSGDASSPAKPTPSFTLHGEGPERPAQPSREEFEELEKKEEVRDLNFIAEHYFQRTLTKKDLETIAYCYDALHFPYELVDYLIEYCADQGKTSHRYLLTVALRWHDDGISSLQEAKNLTDRYQREQRQYFDILHALGISGRSPITKEVQLMDRWLKDYALPMEVIKEACARTVLAASRPTLAYAGKILDKWHAAGVRSMEDVARLDAETEKKTPAAAPVKKKGAPGSFCDYEQRSFDYSQAEKLLRGYTQKEECG